MAREYSNRLYDLFEDGMFNNDQLVLSLIMWMSERDVKEYVIANQYLGFSDLPDGTKDPDEEELDDNAEVPAY
jgi:hypothetical protein